MKKTTCLQLTSALLICLFFCGCQRGPTDEELINTTMNSWKQAVIAQDINAILANYSGKFSDSEAVKEKVRIFMEGAIDKGLLENIDIKLETALLIINDNIAEFSPVELIGDNGEMELEFTLKKEDKKTWRIIESDRSYSCSYERYSSAYGDDCVEHEGYYRCWDIYVPEGLTGNVPLVIDLHGRTSNPSQQRSFSGFASLADSEGFIIVWPYGLCNSWNSGACCDPASGDNIDDVGFIRKLVTQVSGQYNIDLNRIYVTGLSNGCSNETSDHILGDLRTQR
jgi:hypothetical protein